MIGLPRIIEFGWFATYPAEDGGVTYSLCACGVIALIVSSFFVPVGLPCLLACVAALDVLCELTAYEAGALDGHGWVTRVLFRCCLDGQGWGGLGWGLGWVGCLSGSDFLRFEFAVRNRVYLFGTHAGSFVHQGLDQVVPKWFRRWFRYR